MSANGIDDRESRIDAHEWTLFDRLMYGGLGYGAFCLPTNFFKIVFTVIYPPLGEILNVVSNFVLNEFPYITWDTIKEVFNNMDRIIYSFVLTSMFYIPGLIYTLGNISCSAHDTDDNDVVAVSKFPENFKDVKNKKLNHNKNRKKENFNNNDLDNDNDNYNYMNDDENEDNYLDEQYDEYEYDEDF